MKISTDPKFFVDDILAQAAVKKMRVVLPEGKDLRILKATDLILQKSIADVILLGDANRIEEIIEDNLSQSSCARILNSVKIINPVDSSKLSFYQEQYYDIRKHRDISLKEACDTIRNINYYGTMMVYNDDADCMVSGATHATAETVRPALEIIKTTSDVRLVSAIYFFPLSDRIVIYADCAINIKPTVQDLADIAIATALSARSFDLEPKIALLSYSSGDSGTGESVELVKKAVNLIRQKRSELVVEGPIQYDAAADREVSAKKMPNSKIAGDANVFIFPDLNSANIGCKILQYESKSLAIGPILQGLKKPVNDLSRGCKVEDIVTTVAVTVIQAQRKLIAE